MLKHPLQICLSNPSFSSYLLILFSAGMKELSPPPLNLRRLYTETLEWEPVLIIISPGADPSQELAELAAETIGRGNYHEVVNNRIEWEKSQQISKCKGIFFQHNIKIRSTEQTIVHLNGEILECYCLLNVVLKHKFKEQLLIMFCQWS